MNTDCAVCLELLLVASTQFSAYLIPKFYFYHFFCLSFSDVFWRQFLRKMWPIQSALLLFLLYVGCLSSLTLRDTCTFITFSVLWTLNPSPPPHFKTSHVIKCCTLFKFIEGLKGDRNYMISARYIWLSVNCLVAKPLTFYVWENDS